MSAVRRLFCLLLGHKDVEVQVTEYEHPVTGTRLMTGLDVCCRCGRCQ